MGSSLGKAFRISIFGESHGPCIGVTVDGCPAGLSLSAEDVQREVDKRKPDLAAGQTARSEKDKVEILSGLFQGHTTGAPLTMLVRNQDADSTQYEALRYTPRPGHADYTSFVKYRGFNDYRGGGQFSGRVTAGLVMAGAVAKQTLDQIGLEVMAQTIQIGNVKSAKRDPDDIRGKVYHNPVRCADPAAANEMMKLIERTRKAKDSLGGIVEGLALNVPAGLGEPYFDTLEGCLAKALYAIPAVKGVEFGAGFAVAEMSGSQSNDPFYINDGRAFTRTNNAGGVLGGITNGMPLVVRAAIKPTPSISRRQKTVDLGQLTNTEIVVQGRHDVCIVPRAVIVVESVMALVLCDFALLAGIL